MSPAVGWEISVEEEYKRLPKLKPEEVEGILDWASKQPHLPKIPKHRVVMFLRSCDFSLERTKETIDLFYTMRTQVTEMFANLDVFTPSTQMTLKHIQVGMIPAKDDNDTFNFYYRLKAMDLSAWKFEEFAKTVFMSTEMTHLTLGSGAGYNIIADMKEYTVPQLFLTSVLTVQNILKYLQEASHYNVKGLHYINAGVAMEKLYLIAKPFLTKRLIGLVHIHSGTATIFNFVDKKFIPSDYNGSGPSLKELHETMYELLVKKNEWFKSDCRLVVDESKRPASSGNSHLIQGSFRKIAID